jgi:predicted MFS family arabinose efflux permease
MSTSLDAPRAVTIRESEPLSPQILWLMATACAVCVANIYYNQPLLGDFAAYFHAEPWKAGLVATAAQVSYGLGLLFFLPLGDLVERRRLIVLLIYAGAISLVGMAVAPSLAWLTLAQFLVGLFSISAQILIPLATEMARPDQRGKIVGILMSGVLSGILLARVFAGLVADHFGWRIVYIIAAIAMVVVAISLGACLPHRAPAVTLPYARLMHSLLELFRTQPGLRVASAISGLSFAAFVAFWATLSFLMTDRFHGGASEAGLFGIIGLAGAAGAPWAGKLSDRKGVGFTVNLALILMAASFVLMSFWVTITGLIVVVLLMDLGAQSVQVAAQAEVLSLLPERDHVSTRSTWSAVSAAEPSALRSARAPGRSLTGPASVPFVCWRPSWR